MATQDVPEYAYPRNDDESFCRSDAEDLITDAQSLLNGLTLIITELDMKNESSREFVQFLVLKASSAVDNLDELIFKEKSAPYIRRQKFYGEHH